MNIGKFKVDVLDTGVFTLDGGSMFGVVPKALWAKAYHPGDELNRIPLSARPLLVRWDDKKILIDTGNGDKFSDKLANIYSIDKTKSSLEVALKQFDLKPEDIDAVILTHLHFDHVGGATKKIGDKIIPTLPNAKFYVQKDHLNWAKNPTEKDRASFFKDDFMPLLADGLLETIDGEGEIFQGISVIPVNGHTKSMQTVKITDGGTTLYYCADLCPTNAHVPIPYVMGYDNFPLIAIEEKKKIMPQAYEEGWILCYEHDVFYQASTVKSTEKGFISGEKINISESVSKNYDIR